MGQTTSHPAAGFIAMLKSAVIPAFASAMMLAQSAAARSAGLRPTLARNRALYDRTRRKNPVVSSALPLIQVVGSGKPVGDARAIVIAESSSIRAAVMTAW